MSQTWATITTGSQSGAFGFTSLAARTETLRSGQSGATAPSSPAKGWVWYDTGNDIFFYYDGSGWVEYGSVLHTDLDMGSNEILDARLENLGSDPMPAAGNVGRAILHTGVAKAKLVVSSTVLETVVSVSNADLQSVPLPLESWTKDATNPPTDQVIGTTPQWPTWTLDATAERMHTRCRLPEGYSGDADVRLRIHFLLTNAETAADTVDLVLDYKKLERGSANSATGTSTQVTASVSIGSNAGQYTYHTADLVLPYNDADNPLVAKAALALSLGLNAISSVIAISVFDAEILAPCGPSGLTEVA